MGKGYRPGRLGEEIRKVTSDLLLRELKDPRFTKNMVSVTAVDVSSDGSYATLYLTAFGLGKNSELTQEEKDELSDQFTSKLGTPADYAKWAGNAALLPFLRIQVGIADEAVQTKFGSFLNSNNLDDEQLAYMQQIIDYCRTNGDITFMDLQRVSPFCDVDIMDLFGPKIVHIKALINGLHKPVM